MLAFEADVTCRSHNSLIAIPQSILITGASGYVGRHLCARFSNLGHRVLGTTRSMQGQQVIAAHGATPWLAPPVESPEFADGINEQFDVVIHLAGHVHQFGKRTDAYESEFRRVNIVGTENAAMLALRCGAKSFLLASTVAVYGDRSHGQVISSCNPTNPLTPYARSKLAAEKAAEKTLHGSTVALKILRIPMIYGKDAPGNFARLCRVVATGIPLPLRNADAARSLLYIDNLTDALRLILQTPENCPPIALISDGMLVTTADMIRVLANAMNSRTRLFALPRRLLSLASRLTFQHHNYVSLFEPMVIDHGEFGSAMAWRTPFATRTALILSAPDVINRTD